MKSPITALIFDSANFPTFGRIALNATKFLQKTFPKSDTCRKLFHGTKNWYEGGWPLATGGKFSYLPSLVQDAKFDQNYITRREMLRRMRYWSQNSPLTEAILSVGERYTVGASGLHVSFYPSDDISEDADNSWFERAETVIGEWFQHCGWNGESMAELLKVAYRCQKVDGDVFILKTRKNLPLSFDNRVLNVPKPVLQIVEGHRCESPWNQFEQEGVTLVDGVQYKTVDVSGRTMLDKIGYWVRSGQTSFEQNDSWVMVPCDQIWQLRNIHRADQPRSVSDFYSCEVNLNKLEDVITIELSAQNAQSVRAVAIESASGQASNPLDPKLERINAAMGRPSAPAATTTDWDKRTAVFREETGAYIFGLKTGEKAVNMAPTRPSDATLNLLEFLVNSVCAGAHAPRCLVFEKISGQSARAQGTEVRAQLDSADAYFKGDYQKWKSFTREAVIYFMEWAIRNDSRVVDPPANWRDCIHIQQPAACNVDYGYVTNANLMSLAAGATNYHMILSPLGLSTVTVFKQLAREQKMLEKLGIKTTLPALMQGQIQLTGEPPENKKELQTA